MSGKYDFENTDWGKYWLSFLEQIRADQKPDAPPIESYFHPPAPPEDEQSAALWIQYWSDFFERVQAGQKSDAPPIEWHLQPPESPEGERSAPPDEELAGACRADMIAMTKGHIRWEAERFSYNERWGVVWRADFWHTDRNQFCPTRVVRWRTDLGGPGTILSNRENKRLASMP
jgi:hypothetical protein